MTGIRNRLGVSPEELWKTYPRLYHMAWEGSWQTIKCHGLLSTSALLDLYEIDGQERERIEAQHRSAPVPLAHPTLPTVVIRDQHPMSHKALQRCLTGGLRPADWYRTLNAKVFFWLTEERLNRMITSPPYARLAHVVLTLDTEALVREHWDRVWLSPINSGCTVPYAHPRGRDTFRRPDQYPWHARKSRGRDRVVELTVDGGVKAIERLVIAVENRPPTERSDQTTLF